MTVASDVPKFEMDKITYQNAMKWYNFDPFVKGRTRENSTVAALRAEAGDHDVEIRAFDKGRFDKQVGINLGELVGQATA